MKIIDRIYLNGEFVKPLGREKFDLVNPSNNELFGEMFLANADDIKLAVGYAKEALKLFSKSSKSERIEYLSALLNIVHKRRIDLVDAMVLEFGAPRKFCEFTIDEIPNSVKAMIKTLQNFEFKRIINKATVHLESVGVVGIITPWNASNTFICNKLSTAIAAGCTTVIKPAELSGYQTEIISECLHEVGFPKGVINIATGLGSVAGEELANNSDIQKISFTGSTEVGRSLARAGAENFKRLTLELGGKSPNIICDDADLEKAVPFSVNHAFFNSGQGCVASTRMLVHENKLDEIRPLVKEAVTQMKVGDPNDSESLIGPMVSKKQYDRVQEYIKIGLAEGAELLIGGEGKPNGLEKGNFAKPTVFVNVTSDMRIAKEEIFGPVLSIMTYKNDDDAVKIANDSNYGLAGYVQTPDLNRANRIASELQAGYISINGFQHEPLAPFGGVKQSGIGREYGSFGMEEYLEIKTINL